MIGFALLMSVLVNVVSIAIIMDNNFTESEKKVKKYKLMIHKKANGDNSTTLYPRNSEVLKILYDTCKEVGINLDKTDYKTFSYEHELEFYFIATEKEIAEFKRKIINYEQFRIEYSKAHSIKKF